jgi:uncharacterized membrane protein
MLGKAMQIVRLLLPSMPVMVLLVTFLAYTCNWFALPGFLRAVNCMLSVWAKTQPVIRINVKENIIFFMIISFKRK